jgi:hypothetical protein
MRNGTALILSAGLMLSACGGGQTEATDEEEALTNDLQPAAPSPGTVVPSGSEDDSVDGNQMNSATIEAPGGNTQ